MRHGKPLAVVCMLVGAGILPAQQSLGPPYAAPVAVSAPQQPGYQIAPAVGPPPRPDPTFIPTQAVAPQPGPALGPPPRPDGPPAGPVPYYAPVGTFPLPNAPPPPGAYVPLAFAPIASDPRNPTYWAGIEALLWWTKGQPLPVPIITTGPASQGTSAGNIGAPGTTSLNHPLDFGATGGMRFFAGGWLDSNHRFGLDGSLFFLGRVSTGFAVIDRAGNGGLVINEPVVGIPFSTQVSAPGFDTGGVSVGASSCFSGGDVNFLFNLYRANGLTVNLLGGYRYLELNETLDIAANSTMFVATTYTDGMGNVLVAAPAGSTINVIDRFGTRNQFNGGQLGANFQFLWDRWFVGGAVKLGIGATHEVITIDGSTIVVPTNGNPVPLSGGNFATIQSGRYTQDRFALAPEVQLNVGYQVTPWMRATIGYNFLYLTSVARPGNQIDNSFDGVAHPAVPMSSSSYWTQGLNFGLQFSF